MRWKRNANRPDALLMNPGLLLDRYARIAALVSGKTVLDIGCVDHDLMNRDRSHWLHDHLCAHAGEVVGVDICREEVEKLAKEGYQVVCADATQFDLKRTFDVVVAGEILEHVVNAGAFLECACRHMSPDGILIATTPNAGSLRRFLLGVLLGREHDNPEHVSVYSVATLTCLMDLCGLTSVEMYYIMGLRPQGHDNRILYCVAWIKNILKLPFYWLRPIWCRTLMVVCRAKK